MTQASGEGRLSRSHRPVAQRLNTLETQASSGQEGTQAWLVGAGGAGRPAWDLVRYPFCKTRSACHRETLTGNAKRGPGECRVLRPCTIPGLPAGRSAQQPLLAPRTSPLRWALTLGAPGWQAGSRPGRRDCCVARENGCACRYA